MNIINNKNFMSKFIIGCLIIFFIFSLFVGGCVYYKGTLSIYIIFTIIYNAMLLSGFVGHKSYGYLFLVVMLWLGFWLKLTVHLIIGYGFVESIGSFMGGSDNWDQVLWVATLASIGTMMGRLIYYIFFNKHENTIEIDNPYCLTWYVIIRKYIWLFALCLMMIVVTVNTVYGIHQIGMAPRTILQWPLNSIISWMINIGLATIIASLVWWEICLHNDIRFSIIIIFFEAMLSSLSLLSRGLYIFHVIPQMFALLNIRKKLINITKFKLIIWLIIFLTGFIISLSGVTTLRTYLYADDIQYSNNYIVDINYLDRLQKLEFDLKEKLKLSINDPEYSINKNYLLRIQDEINNLKNKIREEISMSHYFKSLDNRNEILLDEFKYQLTGGFLGKFLQLSVDRWIGIEGLMAVQSFESKNLDLFIAAIKEKREVGNVDIYQNISNSIYQVKSFKYQFATLPGAAAFLFLSNSIFVVIVGMSILSLLLLISEKFIYLITGNPLICSLYGFALANMVTQLGVTPRQDLPYIFMIFLGVLLVWLVQSKFFVFIVSKFYTRP
jgi:hypothetical protein